MSRSGVRGVRPGGVDVRKWEVGLDEGGACGSEEGVSVLSE